ncbi:hypothetical protein, partial [Mangrovimonas sp. CR14]|uniref:hypothetical protein n=1 Tax=Mangrovimonas sp. CR14 TaxID=2706120 RepID=UPI00198216A8
METYSCGIEKQNGIEQVCGKIAHSNADKKAELEKMGGIKTTVGNNGYSSLLRIFGRKSSHFCYLWFTVENPCGFSRNETIAQNV